MKFDIYRTSHGSLLREDSCEKEFNTLEEFLKWTEEIGTPIIIHTDKTIEIYDDYRE